jgi:Asp/Glu/hydantoin racemase
VRIWHQGFIESGGIAGYEDALERHVAAVARPGTDVVLHPMPPGSFDGSSPAEAARHAYTSFLHTNRVVDSIVEAEKAGFDAAFVAILQDIGLPEARTLVDIPVAGYGEAAMHLACMLGRRFAILAFNPDLFPLLEDNVARYGLRERLAAMTVIDTDYEAVARGFDDPAPLVRAFEDAAGRALASGADVLVPGQMVLAEILWQNGVHRVDDAPVIDGLGACIKTAESLVDLRTASGVVHSRRGYWGAKPPADVVERARRRYLKS